jgi:hypothetical protein
VCGAPRADQLQVVMHTRIAYLLSNVAELTIFFAAAAALGVGLLGLR